MKNNKTKELIFQTAIKLIRETHTITLKSISETANVNIAAINYYFGDKDTLIKEIISDQLRQLKANLIDLFDQIDDKSEPEQSLCKIVSYMYDFCFENLGLIDYILTTSKQITEEAIFIYVHEISLDKSFMDKVMRCIKQLSPFNSMDVYKVKYIQLFSTFAFPLLFELNLIKVDVAYFNSIADPKFRQQYVKQIVKTFFED